MLKLPWFVCLLVATILGGIWGAIPGFFKAYFNINEVITSIMFNWIGLYLVNELIYQNGTGPMYEDVYKRQVLLTGKKLESGRSILFCWTKKQQNRSRRCRRPPNRRPSAGRSCARSGRGCSVCILSLIHI